jgi:Flp pilus assembly protein TadD
MFGELARAEHLLRRAATHWPDNQALYLNLGQVLMRLGRGAEAERAFSRGINVEPRSPVADAIREIRQALLLNGLHTNPYMN